MPLDAFDAVRPTHRSRGIHWLVVAHVVVGFVAALLKRSFGSDLGWAMVAYGGINCGQICLLGIWSGLRTTGHWKRLAGAVLGVVVLYLSLGLANGELDIVPLVFLVVAVAFVATPFLIARYIGIVISADSSPTTKAIRIQFAIRHLLILTFVVACVFSFGRVAQSFPSPQRLAIYVVICYAVMFTVVGVVPAWFIFATKWPVPYGIALVAISACSGYCLGQIIDTPEDRFPVLAVVTAAALVVVVSLFVVRLCGYRLVRIPKSTPRGSRFDEFTIPHLNDEESQSGNDRLIEASVDREERATPSEPTSASSTSLGRVLPLSPSALFSHLSEGLLLGVLRDCGQ
jgi:hypothetical protein